MFGIAFDISRLLQKCFFLLMGLLMVGIRSSLRITVMEHTWRRLKDAFDGMEMKENLLEMIN